MSPIITLNNGETRWRNQAMTPPTDPKINHNFKYEGAVAGTARLIKMKEDGLVDISDDDIEIGIQTNAERLGIDPDTYKDAVFLVLEESEKETPTEPTV